MMIKRDFAPDKTGTAPLNIENQAVVLKRL
jgi:hypothetical protein